MGAAARSRVEPLSTDVLQSAIEAGLRYVSGSGPCIQRIRAGKGFRYIGPDGKPLRDPQEIQRVRSLVIPPAWSNVWICPSPHGHLQAVGWDVKGRKQYRYHPLYRAVRDQAKFGRMIAFGAALALIRGAVEKDLARPGLPKRKVLATAVRLLQTTYIRVGNDEYAKENESFGLTTMRDKHVRIAGSTLQFRFRGKSGLEHTIQLTDARLAKIVKRCQDLPGYELFQYVNEHGDVCRIDSGDVNRYIREISGQDFTAKDFRTWAGTVLATRELAALGPCPNERTGKRNLVTAIKAVAKRLGNRPATCRKYYVHPAMLEAYSDGSLFEALAQGEEEAAAYGESGLSPAEYAIMVTVAKYQEKLVTEARNMRRKHAA
jgi:DNA topoisomerase-1